MAPTPGLPGGYQYTKDFSTKMGLKSYPPGKPGVGAKIGFFAEGPTPGLPGGRKYTKNSSTKWALFPTHPVNGQISAVNPAVKWHPPGKRAPPGKREIRHPKKGPKKTCPHRIFWIFFFFNEMHAEVQEKGASSRPPDDFTLRISRTLQKDT